MLNGLIPSNPADPCVLPRRPKQKVKPLNEEQITTLVISVIDIFPLDKGHYISDGFEPYPKIKTRYPNGYLVFMAEDEGFDY